MPYTSERQALLSDLTKVTAFAFLDDDEELLDDVSQLYMLANLSCYIHNRQPQYRSHDFFLNTFMQIAEPEFRQLCQTSCHGFLALLAKIQDLPVFHNKSPCNQTSPVWKLAVALCQLGSNGNGASVGKMQCIFGVGGGTIVLFTEWVVEVLLSLRRTWLCWPSEERRREIKQVMQEEGFPGCVGFVDGTTIPLAQHPAIDGEVYWDRKKRYVNYLL